MYWRLLSTDPKATKDIVLSEKPPITTESEAMDRGVLDRLLLHCGSLSSIYHQAPESFIRGAKPKHLHSSPALDPSIKQSFLETLNLPKHIPPENVVSTVPSSYSEPPTLPPKPLNGSTSQPSMLAQDAEDEDDEDTFAEVAGGSQDPYAALGGSFGTGNLTRHFQEEEEGEGDRPILQR
jgi:AP-2 complex subunit beta-1